MPLTEPNMHVLKLRASYSISNGSVWLIIQMYLFCSFVRLLEHGLLVNPLESFVLFDSLRPINNLSVM